MGWTDLTLTVRTPLFIGSANPLIAAQEILFPVPSLRGALRYWLRALVGAHLDHGTAGIATLADVERAIFGAASRENNQPDDDGDTAQLHRSQSTVWLRARGRVPFTPGKQATPWLNHDQKIAYLLGQGLVAYDKDTKQWRPSAGYIQAGQKIHFAVRLDNRAPHPQACADLFYCALWALTTFGGLGARARRGFGTVHLVSAPQLPASGFDATWLTSPTPADLTPTISAILACVHAAMTTIATTSAAQLSLPEIHTITSDVVEATATSTARYPCLRPGAYLLRDLPLPATGITAGIPAALADTGDALREFRLNGPDRTRTEDYEEIVEPWFDTGKFDPEAVFVNAGLGLPVVFTRKSDGRTATVAPRIGGPRGTELRRASPLWLRLYPDASGRWHRRSLAFFAELLPDNADLYISSPRSGEIEPRKVEAPTAQEVRDLLEPWPG